MNLNSITLVQFLNQISKSQINKKTFPINKFIHQNLNFSILLITIKMQ